MARIIMTALKVKFKAIKNFSCNDLIVKLKVLLFREKSFYWKNFVCAKGVFLVTYFSKHTHVPAEHKAGCIESSSFVVRSFDDSNHLGEFPGFSANPTNVLHFVFMSIHWKCLDRKPCFLPAPTRTSIFPFTINRKNQFRSPFQYTPYVSQFAALIFFNDFKILLYLTPLC